MCGIFGTYLHDTTNFINSDFIDDALMFSKLSKVRGQDGMGFLADVGDQALIYKDSNNPAKSLISLKRFLEDHLEGAGSLPGRQGYVGHNRLVTNGSRHLYEDSQPILLNELIGFHVGILLPSENSDFDLLNTESLSSGSDSKFLFSLLGNSNVDKINDQEYLKAIFDQFKGNYSLVFSCPSLPIITLASNCGSLYIYNDPARKNIAFASESYLLKNYVKKSTYFSNFSSKNVSQLVNKIAFIDLQNNLKTEIVELASMSNRLKDGASQTRKLRRKVISNRQVDHARFAKMRRCSKCILPETYPFISFDEKGVCNFCRSYRKQAVLGKAELKKILSKHRSKNGKPDCLVGLSGGRDSCYGLHILKTQLGMNPVAYTYDWGLTSEKSRINQSLLCGKLGVEHVIRAADIEKKRRYVRTNIEAWLRQPHLGMVPIIQAGDKDFIKLAKSISAEMGLDLSIHCTGYSLEQREFFLGFAGVNQKLKANQNMETYEFTNKLRMFVWYSWRFLKNPAYINSAMLDNFDGFLSSFVRKNQILHLYNYIEWDEDTINETLKNEYGWEVDPAYGENQWRMGDGQTALNNYIYFSMAGFSEYDTFRSNQVREGILSREEAQKLAVQDNIPKYEAIYELGRVVGFNADNVLSAINGLPKLY